MRCTRSRMTARLARSAALSGLCAAGALVLVGAGSGARAARSVPARPSNTLYYETQTGPYRFAIEALDLSRRHSRTQVVRLHTASVFGIAVGGRAVYWSTQGGPRDRGSIMRAPLDGGPARRLVGGLTEPGSVVAARGDVYWVDRRAIGRVRLNGSHLQRQFIRLPREAGGGVADGLATDGHHLYFSRCGDDTIGRADLNGRHVERGFITVAGRSCPQGVAVSGAHLYWTELGRGVIGRASLRTGREDVRWLHIGSRQGPFQIAVGGGHVYWTWGGENGSPSYTGRAKLNRSHLSRYFLDDSMYPMTLSVATP